MSDKAPPERIWVSKSESFGLTEEYKWEGDIEYVRADIVEQELETEAESLSAVLADAVLWGKRVDKRIRRGGE